MSKRTEGKPRRKNDAYFTWDVNPIKKLLPYLPPSTNFYEPCAGRGDMVDHLVSFGHVCTGARDIDPSEAVKLGNLHLSKAGHPIVKGNSLDLKLLPHHTECIITNPPWTRELLHPMIDHFPTLATTFLLFDSDWAYTLLAKPYLRKCSAIIPAGRAKWIEGTTDSGKDNLAWYRFDFGWTHGPRFLSSEGGGAWPKEG